MLDVVVHAFNPRFGESEAGEWHAWPTPMRLSQPTEPLLWLQMRQ